MDALIFGQVFPAAVAGSRIEDMVQVSHRWEIDEVAVGICVKEVTGMASRPEAISAVGSGVVWAPAWSARHGASDRISVLATRLRPP